MPRHIPLPPELATRPFSAAEGRALGLGRERLHGRDLVVPFPGVRIPRSLELTFEARCLALDLRLRDDTGFSHLTAARLWGVPLAYPFRDTELLHVSTALPATRVRLAGVAGHTISTDTGFVVHDGLRVTDPATTWIALAGILSLDDLIVAGDHLVLTPRRLRAGERRPYVRLDALAEAVELHRGRHARVARAALAHVRDGAESRQETRLRLGMVRRGLPEPELNVDVYDSFGRWLGRGDMVYRRWRVIVEYDGDHHRTDARQYDKDITRHEGFTMAGFRHVRVRRFGMSASPTSGVARAEAALRAAGWAPADVEKSERVPRRGGWT